MEAIQVSVVNDVVIEADCPTWLCGPICGLFCAALCGGTLGLATAVAVFLNVAVGAGAAMMA